MNNNEIIPVDKGIINYLISLDKQQAYLRGLSSPEEIESYDDALALKPILDDIKIPVGKILSMLIEHKGK